MKRLLWWLPFGRVAEIDAAALVARLSEASPPQVLDVRTRTEWRASHIAGSSNVPITKLRQRLASLSLDRERPVVAICLSAHRSVPAVRLLNAYGFKDVRQLRGGMLAWWRKGLPTVGSE